MTWWRALNHDEPFGLHNLPYGAFRAAGAPARVGVRVRDQVLDLAALAGHGGPPQTQAWARAWATPTLNAFLDLGPGAWADARAWLVEVLADPSRAAQVGPAFRPLSDVTMVLPIAVADYVDFYASEHHATNVGRMFRPDQAPLTPNWKHLPIGYHGRSGTVVVGGTDIVRPNGQRKGPTDPTPVFGPSQRLDIEAELGFVVGGNSLIGQAIPLDESWDHLFGVTLLNDWSARDIQAWEYVPLGPFLGKSFATSISPWVVPMAALTTARVPLPGQHPAPLPYLAGGAAYGLDIDVEVEWNGSVVSRPQYRSMYWSPAQMLTHLSVNGASTRSGDLLGSGTISGPEPERRGSFLELSWNGTESITLRDGRTRTFLEDGDTVTLRAQAPGPDGRVVGFGACTGTIRPAARA